MLATGTGSFFDRSQDDDQSRPMKRPRNWSPMNPYPDSSRLGYLAEASLQAEVSNVPRQEISPQRPQEKEKGRRLSCKECRRLKLKASSAIAYSHASLVENEDVAIFALKVGIMLNPMSSIVLISNPRCIDFWTRQPVRANTEQLHAKILQLSDRVRQLEDGLHALHSTHSNGQSHPLLTPELLQIKTSQEFYVSPQPLPPPMDTAFQREESLRESVGALSLSSVRTDHSFDHEYQHETFSGPPEVPSDILQLSTTFPFPWAVDLKIRARIRNALPAREEAYRVCQEARNNALWQYNLDASETFLPNLLHHCYESPIEDLSPRRLALLLMVLSIGSLVDLNKPLGSLHGEAYHHLARASVCEIPLMEEPDFDELHCLFFMIWYHLIFSDNKKAVGYAWNLMGFVAKLAQGLGLHRESSRMKLIPEEHEKRRSIFWELLNLDCRMSLSLGRPPSICLAHVDIKPPSYAAQGLYVPQEQILYHEWKNAFFIQCLSPALETIIAVKQPDYSVTIALDAKIRDFSVPELLDDRNASAVTQRFLVMQRALLSTGRDLVLLQLHRRFFLQAMSSPVPFEMHQRYAPSVIATHLGASSLITAVEALFEKEQQLSCRFLCFWFNSFSAAATLTLLVSRTPSCPLTPCALNDLDRVCRLFRKAATILPFCAKTLVGLTSLLFVDHIRRGILSQNIIQKMNEKARGIHLQWRSSQSGADVPMSVNTSQVRLGDVGASYVPPSFSGAHLTLCQYLEHLKSVTPSLVMPSPASIMEYTPSPSNDWLPDIYRFNSMGVGIEDRYRFASAPPTPFMPSEPRVGEQESFNFDHGALMTDLEETSYMAWF
ncbi:hypothetical protein VNI00_002681 [Paramarasmius palmivorus]|uniref:Xylanolytic transcriptional activator regulatory domain-containing protein n=1 Tax=Paramarasmius palmivorus TaxID=297713 RepID=A0AAW0DZH1_9AGAR